jgi:hypothetical protein
MNEQRDTYSAEERRLAAALAARARQVTDADLRPPAPPRAIPAAYDRRSDGCPPSLPRLRSSLSSRCS